MALSALPALDLGGQRASWLWRSTADGLLTDPAEAVGRIPVGLKVHHLGHDMVVLWAPVGDMPALFVLDSLAPLSVATPIRCPWCGVDGTIRDGRWLPASKGATA